MNYEPKQLTIVTGHYGSGKTNLCVNLALWLHKAGRDTTLVDLDIVNPYFRSADFAKLLTDEGVHVINPQFANSNLDMPTLGANIAAAFSGTTYGVIDVGGDDAGAAALGQYHARIAAMDYDMFYVVNRSRFMTRRSEEATAILRDIEAISRVKATGIVNNTNLGQETTAESVMLSLEYAQQVSQQTGLPLVGTAVREDLAPQIKADTPIWPVRVFVRLPWDKKAEV